MFFNEPSLTPTCHFGDGIDGTTVLARHIKTLHTMIHLYRPTTCIGICILVNSVLARRSGFCGPTHVVCYCCATLNMLKIGRKLSVLGILTFTLGFLAIVSSGNRGSHYPDFAKITGILSKSIRCAENSNQCKLPKNQSTEVLSWFYW